MKKLFPVLGVVLLLLGLGIIGYQFRDKFNKKPAGLEINTVPSSDVYLNDKLVGQTPYSDKNLAAGSYTIKLVPESVGSDPIPWESRLDLSSLVTTVINYSFASAETDTSGTVLQLIKEPGGKTYISVISDPDAINVTLDGKPNGFTPVTKVETTPGSHALSLSSPGYKKQDVTVNTVKGYNLVVKAKLAVDQITLTQPTVASQSAESTLAAPPSSSATPSASTAPRVAVSEVSKPYVRIQETGTGWLRVRKEPASTAEELGKANTGEKLKYLGESTETGWHKVEFEKLAGWVSGKYVELIK